MYGIKYVYRASPPYEQSPLRLVIYGLFVEALFLWACLKIAFLTKNTVASSRYNDHTMFPKVFNISMSKTFNLEGESE